MTLLEQLRAQLRANLDARATSETKLDELIATVEARGDGKLTAEEETSLAEMRAAVVKLDEDRKSLDGQISGFEAREASRKEAEARAKALPTTADITTAGGVKVKSEARTYSKQAQRRDGVSFLCDVASAHGFGFVQGAQERLSRHFQEELAHRGPEFAESIEQRAAGTGAFAGLVVPQYLTDMVAPAVAAMRPLANICNHHDLPAIGMTVNISRITTATSAALQASENSAVSETNIDDTILSPAVQTISGQQTLSLQAIQRGIGTEDVTVGDLIRRYHTTLDSTLLNQATTGLNAAAGVSVAYTDATPTAPEAYPGLFNLVQQVQTATFMGISHFVMHPRRWWWFASQVGTSWPFLQINNAGVQTAGSVNGTDTYTTGTSGVKVAGYLAGMPVVLDASVTLTAGVGAEDRIYGVTADEAHLWEDPAAPVYIRAEQPAAASLGVLFVVYGFMAYTFQRYASAHGLIQGTGLTTPTF